MSVERALLLVQDAQRILRDLHQTVQDEATNGDREMVAAEQALRDALSQATAIEGTLVALIGTEN